LMCVSNCSTMTRAGDRTPDLEAGGIAAIPALHEAAPEDRRFADGRSQTFARPWRHSTMIRIAYQFTTIRPQRQLIRLFRLEGSTIELSSLRGRPILLNFWASWRAACRMELPILERQYRTAWRNSLHVLAVSEYRGNRAMVERFVKALGLRTLPIYLDPNGYVAYSGSTIAGTLTSRFTGCRSRISSQVRE
jgi:thiol-disulfide isomerase/thioredoxin